MCVCVCVWCVCGCVCVCVCVCVVVCVWCVNTVYNKISNHVSNEEPPVELMINRNAKHLKRTVCTSDLKKNLLPAAVQVCIINMCIIG